MPRLHWRCPVCTHSEFTSFEPSESSHLVYLYDEIPGHARPSPCPTCDSELQTSWICGDCGGSTHAAQRPSRCSYCGLAGTMSLLRTDNAAAGCTQIAVACGDSILIALVVISLIGWLSFRLHRGRLKTSAPSL